GGRTHQLYDLAAAALGTFDDRVKLLLADQFGYRDPANGRIAGERDHRVAVSTHEQRLNVSYRYPELHRQECTVPRRIEYTRHAHDAFARESARHIGHVRHDVERIGNDHEDRVRTQGRELFGNRAHDL